MPTFDSDSVSIHYETFGEGPPVVLVHGFASSIQGNWVVTGWVRRLADAGRRVVALDCRGHGASDKPHDPAAYAGTAMSDDVIRLMDHLEMEQADLVGYSMGGGIALDLVLRHPRRFQRAVLGGVGSVFRSARNPGAIARALATADQEAMANPVARAFREFAEQQGNDLQALAACMQRPRPNIEPSQLAAISVPVLIVVGEKDDIVNGADELARAIPGARLVVVPGCDHLTTVPDHRFKDAALAFLGASNRT